MCNQKKMNKKYGHKTKKNMSQNYFSKKYFAYKEVKNIQSKMTL